MNAAHKNLPERDIERLIHVFGGIRPMAQKLGIPVTTIQGWKNRGRIPDNRTDEIIKKSRELGCVHEVQDILHPSFAWQVQQEAIHKKERVANRFRTRSENLHKTTRDWVITFLRGSFVTSCIVLAVTVLFFGPDILPFIDQRQKSQQVPQLSQADTRYEQTLSNLNQRLEKLNQRNAQLEQQLSAVQKKNQFTDRAKQQSEMEPQIESSTDTSSLSLGKLAYGLKSLQSEFANPQTKAAFHLIKNYADKIEGFGKQIGADKVLNSREIRAMTQHVDMNKVKAGGLLLATAQLRGALDRDIPFQKDLEAVKEMVGNDPELVRAIEELEPYAESGLTSRAALSAYLNDAATEIMRDGYHDGQGLPPVTNPYLKKLLDFIQIERVREIPEDAEPREAIMKAQANLSQGNVAGAINEMIKIHGPAAVLAEPFLKKAEGVLRAEGLMAKLSREISGMVKGSGYDLTAEMPVAKLNSQNINSNNEYQFGQSEDSLPPATSKNMRSNEFGFGSDQSFDNMPPQPAPVYEDDSMSGYRITPSTSRD